jgi:hypothetical protein
MAVNQYDQPVQSQFVPLPFKELFASGDAMRQMQEAGTALGDDLLKLYNVNARAADTERRNQKLEEMEQRIGKVSDILSRDSMLGMAEMKRLKREAEKELTRGELAAINNQYAAEQKYFEEIDELEGYSSEEKRRIKALGSANTGAVQYDPNTGEYNRFQGMYAPNHMDVGTWIKDRLAGISEDSSPILQGLSTQTRQLIQQGQFEKAFYEGTIKGKDRAKIINALSEQAMGDPELLNYLKFSGELQGRPDGDQFLMTDPTTGGYMVDQDKAYVLNPDNPFGLRLAGAARGAASRQVDKKIQLRDNIEAIKQFDLGVDQQKNLIIDVVTRSLAGMDIPLDNRDYLATVTPAIIAQKKDENGEYVLDINVAREVVKATEPDALDYGGLFDYETVFSEAYVPGQGLVPTNRPEGKLTLWEQMGGKITGNRTNPQFEGKITFNEKTYTADNIQELEEDWIRQRAAVELKDNAAKHLDLLSEISTIEVPVSMYSFVPNIGEHLEERANRAPMTQEFYMVNPAVDKGSAVIEPLIMPTDREYYFRSKDQATNSLPTEKGLINAAFMDLFIEDKGGLGVESSSKWMGRKPVGVVKGSSIGLTGENGKKDFYRYQVGMKSSMTSEDIAIVNKEIGLKSNTIENYQELTGEGFNSVEHQMQRSDRQLNTQLALPGTKAKVTIPVEQPNGELGFQVVELENIVSLGNGEFEWGDTQVAYNDLMRYLADYRQAELKRLRDKKQAQSNPQQP